VGPTDQAKSNFNTARQVLQLAINRLSAKEDTTHLIATREIADGLHEMATGLRATYILLEQIDKKLDELNRKVR
jgi:hypothetical protein